MAKKEDEGGTMHGAAAAGEKNGTDWPLLLLKLLLL
jgi:hypothetical protein